MEICENCKRLERKLRQVAMLVTDIEPAPQKPKAQKKPPPPIAIRAATYLRAKVLESQPGNAIGRGKWPGSATEERWARVIDQMVRLDGRRWADIKDLVDWIFSTDNGFVVLSPTALRKKWDRIALAKERSENPSHMRTRTAAEDGFGVL